ncbi:hypothetical protein B0O99DRAFT_627945 [Bisporella sp. PMI_857]|nr:hypothetical protein B0O99DRAFT_627945 [Bisporella sp. PMI_857]
MAPKRIHKKSRFGCDQCKKRHVKCDETAPTCKSCATRNTECHYSRPARPQSSCLVMDSNSTKESTASLGSSLPTVHSATDSPRIGPDMHQCFSVGIGFNNTPFCLSSRQKDLELMHYWFTKTCCSFTADHADLLRGHVVKEALKHEYLADFIFALTSLHIASETSDPVSAAVYVGAALQYQNNAVPSFHAALHNVTQSNCDAIFVSSILTMACSIVSPFLSTGNNDATKSLTESIMLLYDFLNGINSVVNISRHWLNSGPCKAIFSSRPKFEPQRKDEMTLPIRRLRKLNNAVTGAANPLHETYEHAITQLERCFEKDKATAVPWLAMAGKDFANELQKRAPIALMIFVHWGVLLDKLDEMWWAKFSGKKLVEELCWSFNGYGNEWDEATKWAKMEVGL